VNSLNSRWKLCTFSKMPIDFNRITELYWEMNDGILTVTSNLDITENYKLRAAQIADLSDDEFMIAKAIGVDTDDGSVKSIKMSTKTPSGITMRKIPTSYFLENDKLSEQNLYNKYIFFTNLVKTLGGGDDGKIDDSEIDKLLGTPGAYGTTFDKLKKYYEQEDNKVKSGLNSKMKAFLATVKNFRDEQKRQKLVAAKAIQTGLNKAHAVGKQKLATVEAAKKPPPTSSGVPAYLLKARAEKAAAAAKAAAGGRTRRGRRNTRRNNRRSIRRN